VAPITCEGVADYKGIKVTRARPGQWLAVSGAGDLGHLAVRYGKAIGLRVCAVDIDDGKLADAQRLGADAVVNAKNGDPVAAVRKATNGGAQSVLITAPSLDAFRDGVGMIRKRGSCVLVGRPPSEFPLTLFDVVASCITVRASFAGTRQGMAEAIGLALDRWVRAEIEVQPLSAINGVFERLQRGNMASRVVLELGSA
jgi:propanol-preferring alcohol dehydrogenase